MNTPETIYLIRHLSFWYNDEYYQACLDAKDHLGQIQGIFYSQAEAIAHWQHLEYQFSHKAEFSNILQIEYYNDDEDYHASQLAKLSAAALFEIIQRRNCHVYGLYQYPAHLKQQVFFDPAQNNYQSSCIYITGDEIEENCFIHANFLPNDPALAQVIPTASHTYVHTVSLLGSFAQLSDTPLLLQALVEHDADFQRSGEQIQIQANGIAKINPLLKQPIALEVRYLSLEEMYQQQLAQD